MMDLQAIVNYGEMQYGSEPDHPWKTFPEYTVLRHKDTGKWYALVMDVAADKLGLEGAGITWILNVKCDPVLVQGLLQRRGFLPAYHMNKRGWISVVLDGTVPDDEIKSLMDASYQLTLPIATGRQRRYSAG